MTAGSLHPSFTRRRRVLFLGPLPPPVGGMAGYVQSYLQSHVVRMYDVRHVPNDVIPKQAHAGILRHLLNPLNTLLLVCVFARELAFRRPDVAHINASSFGGFFEKSFLASICRLAGIKLVMHLHGGAFAEFYNRSSRPVRWLIRRCLRLNHRVIALSSQMRGVLLGIGVEPRRLVVLENAVHVPERSVWDGDSARAGVTVLFLNRIGAAKGVFELVDAAKQVVSEVPAVAFRIVGPELPDSLALQERIAAEDLGGRVTLVPAAAGDAKEAEYLGAEIYVLPSHVEAMPVGLLEAMSYGLSCIATPVGGVPSVIEDGVNGVLVPVRDARALADAIARLARDPDLRRRLGEAARSTIIERFNWSTRAGDIVRLYEEALAS